MENQTALINLVEFIRKGELKTRGASALRRFLEEMARHTVALAQAGTDSLFDALKRQLKDREDRIQKRLEQYDQRSQVVEARLQVVETRLDTLLTLLSIPIDTKKEGGE